MISKIRIKNFKAIKDSGEIILSPFTAIIGRNGSGKSSLIEAIEFLHDLVSIDLEHAIQKWKSYDSILYHGQIEKIKIDNTFLPQELITQNEETDDSLEEMDSSDEEIQNNYIEDYINTSDLNGIYIKIDIKGDDYYQVSESFICQYLGDAIFIPWEQHHFKYSTGSEEYIERRDIDFINIGTRKKINRSPFSRFKSILSYQKFNKFSKEIKKLQYLNINHYLIGNPLIKPFARDTKKLTKDGSNLYNVLFGIYKTDEIFKSHNFKNLEKDFMEIIRYASEVRETITTDIQAQIFYSIFENRDQKNIEIPSWLLSTGSQKILALLSIIHNPEPSPLIIIEEFENGLDPWTISYLINKFKEFIKKTKSQVIITTHSPTLLNILQFEEILFAKRDNERGTLEYARFEEEKMFDDVQKNILPGELFEKIRKEEFERDSLREEIEKIKKDFKANIKCLVITEDSANIDIPHKMPIYMILKASGFNMEETLIQSYKSKDKIMLGYGIAQRAESYSNINKVIFHRDKDGEFAKKDKEFKSYKEYHGLNKTELFVTNGNDIESYFINKDHIKYLYNDLNEADIVSAIESSIADLKDTSIKKLISNLNDNADAANLLYESDPLLYTYTKIIGKKIHPKLAKFIKGDHSIFKESSFLKDERLEKIAKEIWE